MIHSDYHIVSRVCGLFGLVAQLSYPVIMKNVLGMKSFLILETPYYVSMTTHHASVSLSRRLSTIRMRENFYSHPYQVNNSMVKVLWNIALVSVMELL